MIMPILILLLFVSCAHNPFMKKRIVAEEKSITLSDEQKQFELMQMVRQELREELQVFFEKNNVTPVMASTTVEAPAKAEKIKDTVGRVEWVGIANEGIRVKARVDTGAQTSSLHAMNIKEEIIDGIVHVRFETYDDQDNKFILIRPLLHQRKVRSTTGKSERYVIREKIRIGEREHTINVNLHNRSKLKYRFLVGRNLLLGKYKVDVSQSYLKGRN
jgi:hypothetical protein